MSTATLDARADAPPSTRRVTVDLLYLDLDACDRCGGTEATLDSAAAEVSPLLAAAEVDLAVRKTLVASEEQARALGFVSSPTVRVNGKDISPELRESRCEAEACACHGAIDCRVWDWRGQEYASAPTAMIVDAILRATYADSPPPAPASGSLAAVPDNLRRFFASKAPTAGAVDGPCCPPAERASCCEPSAKAACCGEFGGGRCGCT